MKSVILFRHGKSDWNSNYGQDHDRPVSKRGIKAAKKMGRYLSNIDEVPDFTISSTAIRALNTAKLAIKAGAWGTDLDHEKKIYESTVKTLIDILSTQRDDYENICIVGHEPTFSSFIQLCNNNNWIRFPTASMARINFGIDKWSEIGFEFGSLIWLCRPKKID